jgi:hypothetical protein
MTASLRARPLLLLDVDGPLNPYAAPWFRTREPSAGYTFHLLTLSRGRSYWVALNPTHGRWLRELAQLCDLVWATTWRDDANRLISPILGLPSDLPVVPLTIPAAGFPAHGWKTDQVAEWVGSRPFAWLDDEITDATRERLAGTAGIGPHAARFVPPDVGLATADAAAVADFARAQADPD